MVGEGDIKEIRGVVTLVGVTTKITTTAGNSKIVETVKVFKIAEISTKTTAVIPHQLAIGVELTAVALIPVVSLVRNNI